MSPDDEWPECEEFYNLMQAYRWARPFDTLGTIAAYEAVKQWVRDNQRGRSVESCE